MKLDINILNDNENDKSIVYRVYNALISNNLFNLINTWIYIFFFLKKINLINISI